MAEQDSDIGVSDDDDGMTEEEKAKGVIQVYCIQCKAQFHLTYFILLMLI
jgi:hypothetical protein